MVDVKSFNFDIEGLSEEDEAEGNAASVPILRPRDQRRVHQCHFDGCDSAAVYEVHLHIRYGVRHVAKEHLKSTINICDKHRRAAHDFLLSERNKKNISTKLATIGRLTIDWPNAIVEFVPVGEESWSPEQMHQIRAQ